MFKKTLLAAVAAASVMGLSSLPANAQSTILTADDVVAAAQLDPSCSGGDSAGCAAVVRSLVASMIANRNLAGLAPISIPAVLSSVAASPVGSVAGPVTVAEVQQTFNEATASIANPDGSVSPS